MNSDALAHAEAMIQLGRPADAIAALGPALAEEPDDITLLDALVRAQTDLDPRGALTTSQRMIALDPAGYAGQFHAAWAFSALGKKQDASKHAKAAVEAAPYLANTQAAYAQIVCKTAFLRRTARQAAQRAIELAPEATLGYIAAGNVELQYGKKRAAEKWYRTALSIDPHDRIASLNLVNVSRARGRMAPGILDATAMLRFDPRDPDARSYLDDLVYSTLVHLLWVAVPILWIVALVKGV